MDLTEALRESLRELISNPLQPSIPPQHAEALVRMGLATEWGNRLAITLAGKRMAYAEQNGPAADP